MSVLLHWAESEGANRNTLTTAWNTRDPAVLAALPEVQALIAEAYEVAAEASMSSGPSYYMTQTDGGFKETHTKLGAFSFRTDTRDAIRALTTSDSTAALARIVREAEARGMERAAARARVYASNYEQSSDGRNTFILLAEWADAEAAAILARAAEIERDGK